MNPQICKHSYHYHMSLPQGWIYPRNPHLSVVYCCITNYSKIQWLHQHSPPHNLCGARVWALLSWVPLVQGSHRLQSAGQGCGHLRSRLGRGEGLSASKFTHKAGYRPLPSLFTMLSDSFSSWRAVGLRTSHSCTLLAGDFSPLPHGSFQRAAQYGSWLPSVPES